MRGFPWMMAALTAAGLATAAAPEPYVWGNVRFEGGGFVDGIVASRQQPGLVYIRTDVGGAYRWDSLGGKWIPLMDWISEKDRGLYGTEAIALDPQDPKRLYILCGTSYFSGGKSMILRSADYGNSFDTVNVTSQFVAHGNGMGRQAGEKLAVDPQNSAILFCGSRTKGLFRSADTGKTWTLVAGTASLSGSSIVDNNGISYVLFDPASGKAPNGGTKTVYMGVSSNSGSMYVSNDGGASFAAIAGAPAQMAMRAVLSEGNLYGTFSAGPGPHSQSGGSVWKYAAATGAWTNIGPKTDSGFVFGTGHEGYGYGFGGISVDAKNPKRMILTTEGFYGGNNKWPDGKGNAGDGIFLTEDAGATWKQLNPWSAATPTVDPNGNGWISGSSIHWAGSIEFDPFDSRKVWVVSGNGMFRTDDVGAAVPLWKFQSRGIEETVPMDLVSVPSGPLVTAIMDYDGATYDDIAKSEPQHDHPIGSSNSLGYAAKAGWFLRSGRVTDYAFSPAIEYDVMYLSKDKGRTWSMLDTSAIPGSSGSLAMSADGKVLLMRPSKLKNGKGSSPSKFYRSSDEGKSWKEVAGVGGEKGWMVSDPVNPDKFYIILDGYQGDLLGSSDGGATFAKLSSLVDNAKRQNSASSGLLRAAPGSEGDLWAPLDAEQSWNKSGYSSNGLAHSIDGGKTWTRLNTMDACLAIGLGKAAPGAAYHTLFMWGLANGGPLGIYRSIDKGATWVRVNDDKHQYGGPANGQFVQGDMNVFGRVYMSTAGRGIVYGEPVGSSAVFAPGGASARTLHRRGQILLANEAIVLTDLQGRLVRRSTQQQGHHRMELSRLARGIYVAKSGAETIRVESLK